MELDLHCSATGSAVIHSPPRNLLIIRQGGSGVSAVTAASPLLSSGGATPDISITSVGAAVDDILLWDGSAWVAAPQPGSEVAAGSVTTSDATPTALLTLTPPADSTVVYEATVAARESAGPSGSGYGRVATFRESAGVVTQVGATASLWEQEDVPALDAYFTIAGSNVELTVVGEASVPALPSEPVFVGTVRLVPSVYATVTLAIAAASAGDIIEVAAGATIAEPVTVVVSKSLEIRGADRATSVVTGAPAGAPLFSIASTVSDVFFHDLTISHTQLASTDPGGLSACITAGSMQTATPSGLPGYYIARIDFVYPKQGVAIDAQGWVVSDCTFTCNSTTPGATVRAMAVYGITGTAFVDGCTFVCPNDNSRLICIAPNSAGPRGTAFTGYDGVFVVRDNVLTLTTLLLPRAYMDTTGMFRQPGLAADPVLPGLFDLYLVNNDFSPNYASSPILFFASASISPLSFFGTLWLDSNSTGRRTVGTQKGCMFCTGASAGGIGAPVNLFVSNLNTIAVPALPDGTNVDGSTEANLIGVDTTIFPVPAPLLTPDPLVSVIWDWTGSVVEQVAP